MEVKMQISVIRCFSIPSMFIFSLFDSTNSFVNHLTIRTSKRMVIYNCFKSILKCISSKKSQVKDYHLRGSVNSSRTVNIYSTSLFHQFIEHFDSSLSSVDKILIIHIFNRVFFELDSMFFA